MGRACSGLCVSSGRNALSACGRADQAFTKAGGKPNRRVVVPGHGTAGLYVATQGHHVSGAWRGEGRDEPVLWRAYTPAEFDTFVRTFSATGMSADPRPQSTAHGGEATTASRASNPTGIGADQREGTLAEQLFPAVLQVTVDQSSAGWQEGRRYGRGGPGAPNHVPFRVSGAV